MTVKLHMSNVPQPNLRTIYLTFSHNLKPLCKVNLKPYYLCQEGKEPGQEYSAASSQRFRATKTGNKSVLADVLGDCELLETKKHKHTVKLLCKHTSNMFWLANKINLNSLCPSFYSPIRVYDPILC